MEVCPPVAVVAPGDPPASYANWFCQKPREWQCRKPCVSWRATTWILSISNFTSAKWNINCTFDIADVTVDPMHSELLPRPSSISDNPSKTSLLECLVVGFPTLSMDEDAVYMLSKGCPIGAMEVVIAIDMKKKKVQGVGKLVTGKDFTYTRNCTSEVSKYLSEDKAQVKLDEQT
ncbi:uncharacterized protein LOC123402177 [Hordeum vulgare subsp. vulgare]|uniref:uncharacterized protein LOC123402177 n=1 Tax=Hordeum vulgare subsp. vulgare TaxID=112509 RepID=UPI001D1A58B2|nr:uncharacterized protein LOC123402177 [Hordeum vulgare subsp. vulgare]